MDFIDKQLTFTYKGFTADVNRIPEIKRYKGKAIMGGIPCYFYGDNPAEMEKQFRRLVDIYISDLAALTHPTVIDRKDT